MKSIVPLAVVSAVLLALFLLLRPVIGGIGNPTAPDVNGRAQPFVTDGATGAPPSLNPPRPNPSAPPMTTKPSAGDAAKLGISHLDQVEQLVFELTNAERRKAQLGDLAREDKLRQIAEEHSDDMLARGFFEHVNPDGQSPADRVALEHRQLIGVTGENIWTGTGVDISDQRMLAETIVKKWMASSEHKDNILKAEYTHLGVGISARGKEVRATQLFADVQAFLAQPAPQQSRTGDGLNLAVTPYDGGSRPERYDFLIPDKGIITGKEYSITDGRIDVGQGVYKLRFHFPKSGGGYSIYDGPQLRIQ